MPELTRNERINLLCNLTVIGSLVYFLVYFISRHYWGMQFPYFDAFLGYQDAFTDYFDVNVFISKLNPYIQSVSYPPFGVFIAYPFSQLTNYLNHSSKEVRDSAGGMVSLLFLVIPFILFLGWLIYRSARGQGWIKDIPNMLYLLITLPVITLVDRGNYLILSFICLALFLIYYDSHKRISLFSLAAAISMKIYPAIFLLLLVFDKRYRDLKRVLFAAVVLSAYPLLVIRSPVWDSLIQFLASLKTFASGSSLLWMDLSNNISLDAPLKMLAFFTNSDTSFVEIAIYFIFKVILILLALIPLFHETKNWKRILVLTLLMILLPSVSMEYNLIYLYLPISYFLLVEDAGRDALVYLIAFAVLLVPKAYYVIKWGFIVRSFTIQPVIVVIVLVGLLVYYAVRNIDVSRGIINTLVDNGKHRLQKEKTSL